jgi:ABC-type multidrug transport system ATPase subunit
VPLHHTSPSGIVKPHKLNYILQTHNLSKHYGPIRAINELTFSVAAGNVFGILGPNGSGKTTTLAIITGVIHADKGEYSWFSQYPAAALRKKIGSLIEIPNFYPYLSLAANLRICALIKNAVPSEIERVLKITGLNDRKDSKYNTLSLGMKQRLALASVLIGDPEVLVLDEPANGLDPEGIAEVRNIILREAERNKTIILASHILDEVEKVCTHVAVLKEGEVIAAGRVHELLAAEDLVILSTENIAGLEEEIVRSGMTVSVNRENDDLIIILKKEYKARDINDFSYRKGYVLSSLYTRKRSLESQFLELVK